MSDTLMIDGQEIPVTNYQRETNFNPPQREWWKDEKRGTHFVVEHKEDDWIDHIVEFEVSPVNAAWVETAIRGRKPVIKDGQALPYTNSGGGEEEWGKKNYQYWISWQEPK